MVIAALPPRFRANTIRRMSIATTPLTDRHGLSVAQAMRALEKTFGQQPKHWGLDAPRVKLAGGDRSQFFSRWHASHDTCWLCGEQRSWVTKIEAHHAARSDEACCLFPLCKTWTRKGGCHINVAGRLPELLWAMGTFAPEDADWTRLARLLIPKRKLPEPRRPAWTT